MSNESTCFRKISKHANCDSFYFWNLVQKYIDKKIKTKGIPKRKKKLVPRINANNVSNLLSKLSKDFI